MCALVVVGLCLVGGVVWNYSSSPAPGQSDLNQGEGVCFVNFEWQTVLEWECLADEVGEQPTHQVLSSHC